MKWTDWREEMTGGFVFKRSLPSDRQKDERIEPAWNSWPLESEQVVVVSENELPPTYALGAGEWSRVWKLRDVENIYDLGFVDNMLDVFFSRGILGWGADSTSRSEDLDVAVTSPPRGVA
jgi:hypothetical protein